MGEEARRVMAEMGKPRIHRGAGSHSHSTGRNRGFCGDETRDGKASQAAKAGVRYAAEAGLSGLSDFYRGTGTANAWGGDAG